MENRVKTFIENIPDSILLSESQELYQTLLEMSPFPILISSMVSHQYLLVNSTFCELSGFKKEDVIGRTVEELGLVHPEDYKAIQDALIKVGEVKNFQSRANREGLSTVSTSVWVKKIRYQNQDCSLVMAQFRTPEINTQTGLAEKDKRFHTLLSNINESYFELNPEGNFTFFNDSLATLFGGDADTLKGKNIRSFANNADALKIDRLFKVIHSGQSNIEFIEFELNRKDGKMFQVEASFSSLIDAANRENGFYGILRDRTEQKKTEQRLLQAHKMEAIGTLAGGVAHDFNNILSAIIGYSELALSAADKGTRQEKHLNEVLVASNRAKDLVHQILAFSRQSEESLSPVMVNIVIKEVLKLIRSFIPSTIELRANIVSKSSVLGNSTQIHQIIMNLCTNAAHAMEKSGGVLTVDLTDVRIQNEDTETNIGLKDGNYVKLRVGDTGCGIAPEIINNIFDPYFTTKDLGEGTGMGLSVVQGIVENYSGRINAESTLGKGSVFSVYLPVCETNTEKLQSQDTIVAAHGERLLIVDDEQTIVEMAGQLLQEIGYKVTAETDSLKALKLFAAKPDNFDLVITDMTMPKMTGDLLAAQMMRIRPGIPVILTTGYSKQIDKKKALAMGIKAFIHKPISKEKLSLTIRKVLDEDTKGSLKNNFSI